MEEEKKEHEAKMKKMETEMEQVFEMKVNEKINKLKESESDVRYIFKFLSFQNRIKINLI
jgi:septin 7